MTELFLRGGDLVATAQEEQLRVPPLPLVGRNDRGLEIGLFTVRSGQEAVGGSFVVGGFILIPISAQVNPGRVHSLNQRELFGTVPLFQLSFATDGVGDLLVRLKPHEPIAVVGRAESFELFPFVLEDPLSKVSCYSDVESAAAAGNDIGGVDAFIHSGKVNSADGCAR
jgi:hypothetical protein